MMGATSSGGRHRVLVIVLAVVLVAMGVVAFLVVRDLIAYSKPNPEFPSLADGPDPSLRGTVAYTEVGGTCVRIVAAAGGPSKDVLCFGPGLAGQGPELAWLPDGRLQVTMFQWPAEQPIEGLWQKIVDVRTGAVEDVPEAEVPDAPTPATEPPAGPNGERITATSEGGRIEIVLSDPSGSRTLLSAQGNPNYRLAYPPLWSPDWQWILVDEADEGRLLLVTVGAPSQTRVLVARAASFGSSGILGFAVTGANLLEPES